MESKLKLFSLGIVVVDKPDGSDVIQVYPVEGLPHINGSISEHKQVMHSSMPDSRGSKQQNNITGTAVLTATWMPNGTNNRMTSPDVVKNESVVIYRFGDTDEFYWTTIFREPSLRRLERVCYMYSNLRKPLVPFNKNSSYWMEIDTKNKNVQLHTSSSDREPVEYDIVLDTGNGTLTIKDSKGNIVNLNSVAGVLTAKVNSQATITAPAVTLNANVTINGNLTVNGIIKGN